MSVHDAYESNSRGYSEMTSRASPGVPGWVSWLALMLVSVCAVAWARNESIVVWLLSQGLVEEAATGTAPTIVGYSAIAAGVLSMIVAWRIFTWSGLFVYRWGSVETSASYLEEALRPMVTPLWVFANASVRALGRALAMLLGPLRRGFSAFVRAVSVALEYARLGISAVLGAIWLGSSTAVRVSSSALGFVWLRILAVATFIGYLGMGVSAVAKTVGVALVFGIYAILYPVRPGASSTSRVISLVVNYVRMGASTVAGYVRLGVSIITGHLRVGTSAVVQAAGFCLQRMWSGVSTAFGYLRAGVSSTARVINLVLRYLRLGASTVAGYVRLGVSIITGFLWVGISAVAQAVRSGLQRIWLSVLAVARAVSNVLGYLKLGISAVVRPLRLGFLGFIHFAWLAVLTVAQITVALIELVWLAASAVLGYLWQGISTLAKATGVALHPLWLGASAMVRILWLGFSSIIHSAWLAVLTVAQITVALIELVWLAASAVLGYLWQGISTLAKATGVALRPLWLGASTIVRYLWLGVSTTVLIFRWTLGAVTQGVSMAIQGFKRTGFLVIRTVRTACGVVPDLGRMIIWSIKERKGVPRMSDFNLTRQRLLSLVVTVLVIFAVGSVLVRVLWPAQELPAPSTSPQPGRRPFRC